MIAAQREIKQHYEKGQVPSRNVILTNVGEFCENDNANKKKKSPDRHRMSQRVEDCRRNVVNNIRKMFFHCYWTLKISYEYTMAELAGAVGYTDWIFAER